MDRFAGAYPRPIDAYKRCREWIDQGIAVVKPGATTAQIAAVWPSTQKLGFPDEESCFGLEFGHGIGLGLAATHLGPAEPAMTAGDDTSVISAVHPGCGVRRGGGLPPREQDACEASRPETARRLVR
jgi:hypothetical protein